MDASEEIKRLYFNATPKTIARDLDRAIELLKTLPDEEARERLAVYMDGLSQMRSEMGGAGSRPGQARKKSRARPESPGTPKPASPRPASASASRSARPRRPRS